MQNTMFASKQGLAIKKMDKRAVRQYSIKMESKEGNFQRHFKISSMEKKDL